MSSQIKKEKQFRKVKVRSIGGSIASFLVFTILAAIIFAAVIQSLVLYVIDAKLSTEYDRVERMAQLYNESNPQDPEAVEVLLDVVDRDYVIRDTNGTYLHQKGEATFDQVGQKAVLSGSSRGILFYRDTSEGVLYINDKGLMSVDMNALGEWIGNHPGEEVIDTDKLHQMKNSFESGKSISVFGGDPLFFSFFRSVFKYDTLELPIWLSESVQDNTEELIVRAMLRIDTRDTLLLMELVAVLMFLIVIILIVMLVSAINGFVKQRRIARLFFTDEVTDGHNWMWFLIRGGQRLRRYRSARNRYAVVNLVFIKYRNYCLCHSIPEGEKLLRRVYEALEGHLGQKEMCAHCTSSNFALLLRYNDEAQLKDRMRRIIGDLERISTEHKFSFQAGISLIEPHDQGGKPIRNRDINLENEYNNACAARASLSDSEDSGVAVFDRRFVEDQRWLDRVEERQAAALANEEFLVYYQPKYDPATNKLRGAEALIRWQSPELGFVSPGQFIPIFEKNGFITEIDHYMLAHVARDQKKWLDMGYPCVPVSVNVSRAHFVESDLAEQIINIVDQAGTPHDLIEIELTESAFFDDKKAMIGTISKLQQSGFAVSMDDFGSGYSSLNSLKDLPLNVLKLDAEFFRGENSDERGRVVVSEAISIAKKLNMRTVAEGVEEESQVEFLASQGCDMIQGYYYAKPMPASEYEQRMGRTEADTASDTGSQ